MFINIPLSQCADIDLEFTFCRKCIAQFIIQTMNSLYNQHILRTKLEKIAGTPSRRFTEADLAGEWEIIRVQEPRYERQLEAGQILPASIY